MFPLPIGRHGKQASIERMAKMTRNDIAAVIKKVPKLTSFGIGLYQNGRGLNGEQKVAKLKEGQNELLGMARECTAICNWLSGKAKIKTINKRHSSYGLKHMAEKEIGYITNGAFICAALFCGFKFKVSGPNAHFNISEKSLNE